MRYDAQSEVRIGEASDERVSIAPIVVSIDAPLRTLQLRLARRQLISYKSVLVVKKEIRFVYI